MAYPILALWAHPRSMSTAFERVMRERGDLTVFHEPFMADYLHHRAPRTFAMLEDGAAHWVDYPQMRDRMVAAANDQPVFFKDMSYYVMSLLADDPVFCRRCLNLFLVRDPRPAIASWWRKDTEVTCSEIGYEDQWRHVQLLQDLGAPLRVVRSETVAADPRGVIGRIWDWAGLPDAPQAFAWQAGETPADWRHVQGWHPEVIGSTGLRRDDRDPDAVFAKVAAEAPHLPAMLDHHAPFYDRLCAMAVD